MAIAQGGNDGAFGAAARGSHSSQETPARRRLPLGIQTFREIREGNYYYVDKTAHALRMIEGGKHYFLSRPRRFGKSLLLDTFKELFEGSEELFRGLHVHDRWDWSVRHPVLRLDFGGGNFKTPGQLEARVMEQLAAVERREGATVDYATAPGRFANLLESLHEKHRRRVVVLVDEYDKPILDALDVPEVARANRDFLRGLYGTIKASDAHVRFTLLVGVSKFSKANLFSGLNNLTDITLDARCSSICGYTDADIDTVFAPELDGLDRDEIRAWYDGYAWLGEERVYNPYDVLLLFERREFDAYWFETGTPTFLLDMLLERRVEAFALEGMLRSGELLSTFDVGNIAPEALLFQTGYLTIRGVERRAGELLYRLEFPNREVRRSLNRQLVRRLAIGTPRQEEARFRLYDALLANDFEELREQLEAIYAGIPHDWYRKNGIADYEGYYASVFYACVASLGMDVRVEDSSSRGRVDMAVRFNGNVYLFEFKVAAESPTGAALAQLQQKGYADKYRGAGEPIHLIGVEFSREARNVVGFETARA